MRRTRAEAERQEAAAREEIELQFRQELPKQMLGLMGWAHKLGVPCHVEVLADNDTFWCVHFEFPERRDGDEYITDEHVSFGHETERWALGMLIKTLQEHETFLTAQEDRLRIARAAYDALSPIQRRALGLTHRP